jgi:hypothetical protein
MTHRRGARKSRLLRARSTTPAKNHASRAHHLTSRAE